MNKPEKIKQIEGQLLACEARIRQLKAALQHEQNLVRALEGNLLGITPERQIRVSRWTYVQ